ncbi:hypothetical protein MKEN_01371300 [Mycena kentingensis (nom. inval.)]|nr:hypothetical protein MKEN_01371300 [Mycena kentingensis (nom. inval.)]
MLQHTGRRLAQVLKIPRPTRLTRPLHTTSFDDAEYEETIPSAPPPALSLLPNAPPNPKPSATDRARKADAEGAANPPKPLYTKPAEAEGGPRRMAAEKYIERGRSLIVRGIPPTTSRAELWRALTEFDISNIARVNHLTGDTALVVFSTLPAARAFFLHALQTPVCIRGEALRMQWNPRGPGEPTTSVYIGWFGDKKLDAATRQGLQGELRAYGYIESVAWASWRLIAHFGTVGEAMAALEGMQMDSRYAGTQSRIAFAQPDVRFANTVRMSAPEEYWAQMTEARLRADVSRFGDVVWMSFSRKGEVLVRLRNDEQAQQVVERMAAESEYAQAGVQFRHHLLARHPAGKDKFKKSRDV